MSLTSPMHPALCTQLFHLENKRTTGDCSTAVAALLALITPLPYSADFRPYFTIHDPSFAHMAAGTMPAADNGLPRLLGVTNLYFLKVVAVIIFVCTAQSCTHVCTHLHVHGHTYLHLSTHIYTATKPLFTVHYHAQVQHVTVHIASTAYQQCSIALHTGASQVDQRAQCGRSAPTQRLWNRPGLDCLR